MPDTHEQETSPYSAQRSPQHYARAEAGSAEAAYDLFKDFARERPEVVAMWAFGLGFVLGWKLRIF